MEETELAIKDLSGWINKARQFEKHVHKAHTASPEAKPEKKRSRGSMGKSDWMCVCVCMGASWRWLQSSWLLRSFMGQIPALYWILKLCFEQEVLLNTKAASQSVLWKDIFHVMQEDKCDFGVFFNNAVGKCNVIDQSRAGNRFAGPDLFCLRQTASCSDKLDRNDHRRNQKHI